MTTKRVYQILGLSGQFAAKRIALLLLVWNAGLPLAAQAPAQVRAPSSSATAPEIPIPISVPIPDDRMGVTIHRLSNGLTVYLSPNHQEPRVAAWVVVRAGAKHD